MAREVARADQDIVRVAREIAVVLPVHEQQVHAEGGRLCFERVGHAQQHSDARCAVVRPGDGKTLLAQVLALVGMRPRVPMREQQHPVGGAGPEAGEKVAQVQRLAVARDVGDRLHHDAVGRGPEVLQDPIARALVPRRSRDARSELHLLLEIAEGARAAELSRLFPAARRASGYEGEARGGAPQAALSDGHRGSDVL